MSIVFIIIALVLIVLLCAVLIYQVRLIRRVSFLKAYDKKDKKIENELQKTQNPVLYAVIIAAINQYKNQNSQR